MIFWLTSSRHSTKLNIAYSYFTSYNLMRKDPLKAGLFLSVQQFHPSMMAKMRAILSIDIRKLPFRFAVYITGKGSFIFYSCEKTSPIGA